MSNSKVRSTRPKRKPLQGPAVVLLAILASSGALLLGMKAARPFLLASQLHSENDMIEHRVKQLQLENQQSERDVKALQTPAGINRAGREHGFVLPGEQHLHLSRTE